MSRARMRITQTSGVFSFLRHDASGATPPVGPWLNYDNEATRVQYPPLTPDDIPLWSGPLDTFYFGHTTPFGYIGFLVGTIQPQHSGFTIEYFDGVGWTPFSFKVDTTAGLSETYGYLSWPVPGGWSLTTINGASAFWVRVRSTGVTVAGRARHFLPCVEGKPPIKPDPQLPPSEMRYTPDVNNDLKNKDSTYNGPRTMKLHCTQNAFTMNEIHLLQWLAEHGPDVRVDDLALSNPSVWATDAHYLYYTGKLDRIAGLVLSPHKMSPDPYSIDFLLDGAFSLFSELGLTT